MARKIIDIGTIGNDGTGDSIRDSFRKVNDNFRELYSSLGLGDRLTFIGLGDTPSSYTGQENAVLTVNQTTDGVKFKQIVGAAGVTVDNTTNENEIRISTDFSELKGDPEPKLGGDLSAFSGGNQYRILGLDTPTDPNEAVNKEYADSKVSKAGVNAINPETGVVDASFGTMSGPLILSRNPEAEDDEVYDGLIAATKRYVDTAGAGSQVNLYVSTSGSDENIIGSIELQGRSLPYAYRTLEAALKRAEEIMRESLNDIGPYRKVLTYNNGQGVCTLTEIDSSPVSGVGFAGSVTMSVDTIELATPGVNYNVGDIIELDGGTGTAARYEVLSTASTPGAVVTFRQLSSGVYSVLPGSTGVATTSDSAFGAGVTFNVTYKVNNVTVTSGGSGYSLVSVRINPAPGDPNPPIRSAFGTAIVVGGVITEIRVTDEGSGFTAVPVVQADLPRFFIKTENYRTDFTGDVLTDTPVAYRGRDIREGLFLQGVESGALAQILAHEGALDSEGNEIFDVDIQYGSFQEGEPIAYGDVAKVDHISVLVESGVYYENYPLKVPANVSIVGNEFRRVIIKPRPGTSSSPWAFQKFRRDLEIDGLTFEDAEGNESLYGYHYLHDKTQPVYPKIDNGGEYNQASILLNLNRRFIQNEVIGWIDYQIANNNSPFTSSFVYNSDLCKRDVGLLIDAIIFDIKYGGYNRTISAALKYFESTSSRIAITTQKSETIAGIQRIYTVASDVIANTEITTNYQDTYPQIVDNAYTAESGADTVISTLIDVVVDVIDGSGSVNYPKENEEMDVFLANDSVRWQAISCIGHGGFMCVLDPEGQILSRSPYAQECASFSRSKDRQVFAGGMFVDGFTGNLEFKIISKDSNTRISVTGLERKPQLPCSFIVEDTVYRVNYIRDWSYDKDGSSATFILDETTEWPYPVFTYNDTVCSRDVGLIIDGLGYDLVFGSNYHARKAGLTYRQANAEVVVDSQNTITRRAIEYTHGLASDVVANYDADLLTNVDNSSDIITTIIERGSVYAPVLSIPSPTGLTSAIQNAKDILSVNIDFIQDETTGWINAQIAAGNPPFDVSFTYNQTKCSRDVGYIIEALMYDLVYGGNSQTVDAGLKYYDGVGTAIVSQNPGETDETAAAIDYVKYLAKQVIINAAPSATYSSTPQDTTTYSASDASTQATIETLLTDISTIVSTGVGAAPAITYPDLNAYTYDSAAKNARTGLQTDKTSIRSDVVDWVDENANKFELLMPGNRSMLGNDFTQVNDLGYGIAATNGGLIEAVSIFTYYCHISYYSLNGAQIRSVGGSSSHGNYALVAEGSDPLELATPTTLYYELAQRVDCYYPSPSYANTANGLFVYVNNYDYEPLNSSELEVDHGNLIFRYPVTSVTTTDLPDGVARLNLTSDESGNFDGLYAQIVDGTKMTLRSNAQLMLTGSLEEVAVRPSTGLILQENTNEVYRVLQFEAAQDSKGPFEIEISVGDPAVFTVLQTVTTIASNVCTTAINHNLRVGDKFIPKTTANGFTAGATYYIIEVQAYNQFSVSNIPGGTVVTLTNGTGLSIKGVVTHNLITNYTLVLSTTGALPTGASTALKYWVLSEGLTDTEFLVSISKAGTPVATTLAGSGEHFYTMYGLTRTTMRENYNYVDLTLYLPGEYDVSTVTTCSISLASPGVISTATPHGLSVGDCIRFTTTGALPTGLNNTRHYFVFDNDADSLGAGSLQFTVSTEYPTLATAVEIDTSGSQSGTHSFGLVTGRSGDTSVAVVPVAPTERIRVPNSLFVWKGEEYVITSYESEDDLSAAYARITFDRALEDSLVEFSSAYTIRSGVPARTIGADGNLTIRISLTRVTSHDLLEIGTGSYADTNYPKEIYGPSVNPINADTETDERDVGRVFYVTTDQYGNFSVGPYFRVDQGTGQVTFSAAIALSNLDGIGFKRGVPVSEFSTDSGFTDNAVDTVPTENATRLYIDRRLGLSHTGSVTLSSQLIPPESGGFMALDGQLAMKADMNLDSNKIFNLADPTGPLDAVNLQSLTFENLQNFNFTNVQANQILLFTGEQLEAINADIVGDVSFDIDSTANTVDVQINPDTIINSDIHAPVDNTEFTNDAIVQSKLKMNKAGVVAAAPTGTEQAKQATLGVASFNSAQFSATDGWVSLKTNGTTLGSIQQLATRTVIGNAALTTATATEVTFATVVNDGGAVKKSQFSLTGFLRRKNASAYSADTDYEVIDAAAGSSVGVSASKLIQRDSNGDFGGRNVDVVSLYVDAEQCISSGLLSSGNYFRISNYDGNGGILLQNGTAAGEKKNLYDNDAHEFRTENGLNPAPISCSTITTTAITTGGNTTAGTITGRWTLTGTSPNESRLQATYSADLAEYYEGDKEYEVGTVLVFGGDKEVTISTTANDRKVAGVVSNTAAFAMYEGCPGAKNLVALQGRVPVKVIGKVEKGDILVTSDIEGVAIVNNDPKPGMIIGKALENYNSSTEIGTIEVAVGRN